MKRLCIVAAAAISSLAMAQGPGFPGGGGPGGPGGGFPGGFPFPQPPSNAISTASDFGSVASLGANSGFQSTATGTTIARALVTSARVGNLRTNSANASSVVSFARSREGDGVAVLENGFVSNSDPTIGGSAGTSNSAPGSTSPTQGAHSISVNWPGLASGANAIVTIHWRGRATTGASVSTSIDVDGDGTADFTGSAGAPTTQLLQVTAGATGVTIAIETAGSASLAANGNENYNGEVSVFVMAGTLPTSCTFTNFDVACGADLNGTVGTTGLDLSLDITNAPANKLGFFMVGDQLTTPTPLPAGTCNLLIDGRRFFLGWLFHTDATGAASVPIPTPRTAITVSFQAVIGTNDPVTNARTLVASNGTELVCQ